MANLKNTSINDAQFRLPVGDTAARPGSPNARQIRFNTETGKLEQFRPGAGDWIAPSNSGVIATGGDSLYDVDVEGTTYRVHVFTATGTSTFEVLQGGEVEYLIVAGGGGGGGSTRNTSTQSGGGGAGGVALGSTTITAGSYTVEVGAGGSTRNTGIDSTFNGIIAKGGGFGAYRRSDNKNWTGQERSGGCGGGGGYYGNNEEGFATQPGTNNNASDFGSNGGRGWNDNQPSPYPGSGGGGAGQKGEAKESGVQGGKGGDGISFAITGTFNFYAGGGGGAGDSTPGAGGLGGGGRGGIGTGDGQGINGQPNTGAGGGGGGDGTPPGGDGGSGIVIIRYPLRQENPVTAPGRAVGDGLVLDLDFAKPTVYNGSGSTVTDSRLSREGVIENSITYNNPRTHRAYFDFAGSNNIIRFDNFTDYTDKITIEVVSLIKSTGAFQRIVSKHQDGASSGTSSSCFQLQNTRGGNYRWSIVNESGNYFDLNSGISPTLNQIYHFVGTYDGSTMRIFVDGTEIDNRSASGNIIQSSEPLVIGAQRNGDGSIPYEYGGDLFVARVYNTSLSAEQIQQNFNFFRWRFGV